MISLQLENQLKKILFNAGCSECYLFGSHINNTADENSDIDIGVIGLPPKVFFSVHSKLEEIAKCSVDLVDFDEKPKFYNLLKSLGELKRIG